MPRTTKRICLYAMGVALFVALTMCVQTPVFENYYLCLGYAVIAVYCFSFGPAAGALVGSAGTVLYCLLTSGLRGMPGWALGNAVIGVMLGVAFRALKAVNRRALRRALQALAVIAASACGVLVVKSLVECALYSHPFLFRAAKNVYAFIADAAVLLVSLPMCEKLDASLHQYTNEPS